ncbi:MAG: acetyl-CoA carboxylase biotin carboxyl carrier protein [Flavobacteriales bacterium]|jgi:acetyl-CoA carboxylase biotin carboxyl carrier protein|uniref:acetyl-CoA carboxylase biotin carboxyl carrier protein n=1 Tax=Blattabacterium sp. (Mastotermes darwiniensis) TaxID=39768 RepID=UPI000231DDF3|nr:acetyl-CoA carboxylase biotin carboxyl carrier protein [Blattabacterium sp. (Mastotermes darwiniensis)]AER40551.1 biotin carboxyl carrier protein of acetyl-CoA carboxylase [Blattabacterium sp. (Mastotermes darwiniensis) str. MADAR]MDR1805048.1 acetyl-CoA carboxylase biotin carboxyl carrier protein [Flavobacteriales bacterium]
MDYKNIKSLIQFISKSDIHEIMIKIGETEIHIKNKIVRKKNALDQIVFNKNNQRNPSYISDFSDRFSKYEEKKPNNNRYITIRSPMIGTFYRRPHPNQEPFVKVGDEIKIGTKICVIEAMKLFNDIESEVNGKIVKILVEDSTPVDYDQPLFLLDPMEE